ncbi:uncharacterized protein LOC113294891 [Papaver somniferum]|uniref:uncharacterized protein LOC113294891 n=1 Tax=Papaver somniferum TaxID=3469 RepID=UPI000E701DA7|nr:uncharacterized protein LOC113294891 [Papaver somniferum]
MVMQCERSRKFSDHRSKTYMPKTTAKRKRKRGTIKCDCPFKINSSSNKDGKWVVRVKCGYHNHSLPNALTGHSYPGRLNEEEMVLVEDLTKAGVNPRGILTLLKEKFPNNHSTMRTIYNARAKLNLIACQGRNVMQQFMLLSQERHYTVEYSYDEETNETNRYKLPLLHMVSHTSTGATFTVAVAFLNREQEENYAWELECVKCLYRENEIPSVFVTDREIALINAVERVFPHGTHLLCTWHIGKAVLSQAQKHYKIKSALEEKEEMTINHKDDNSSIVKSKTKKEILQEKQEKRQIMLDTFIDDWHSITWAQTRKDYEEACKKFIVQWEPEYKGLVDYVTTTWLKPYKEKFVYAWTNEVKHFDNVATSRVESAHHKLKLYLGSSGGTFLSCWIKGHIKHENEFVGVVENFEKSATQTMHEHMEYPMLKEIQNFVSHKAISYLIDEFRSAELVKNGFPCDHVKRKTLGIPCASFEDLPEIQALRDTWERAPDNERVKIRADIKPIVFPGTTNLLEPKVSEVQRGRMSNKQRMIEL